ncbi:MAG: DNA gyrase subunit A, partial [Kiritimatiellia bacterium]
MKKKSDSPQKPPTRDIFLPGFLDDMQGTAPDQPAPVSAQDEPLPPPAPGEPGSFAGETPPPPSSASETAPHSTPPDEHADAANENKSKGNSNDGNDDNNRPPPPADASPAADGDDDAAVPSEPEVFDPRSSGPLARVMDDNFLQFASYSICDRAIPTVEDGLKPVQRRILHTLFEMDDGRFIKVATVVGRTMFYHPHGDQSIYGALVNLANKRYLIEGQGNFGNIYTGDDAAAPRYIECRLTDLAREEIFNPKTTKFIPS